MAKAKEIVHIYGLILLGAVLYAISTVLFIFPHGLLLGGTSGISVILEAFLPFSPGTILLIINSGLVIAAFAVLGKQMGIRTFVGSTLATVSITLLEQILKVQQPPIDSPFLSALIGAAMIAVASGIMFYVDSSSGGTDVIALIVRKFSAMDIGKALLVTDVLIVVVGGILSGWRIGLSSFAGLLVKTLGIDLVIALIKKWRHNNV